MLHLKYFPQKKFLCQHIINITSSALKGGGIITNGAVSSSLLSFRESEG